MDNKLCMDDLEAFVLDFLAYRRELREKRMAPQPVFLPSAPKHLEYQAEPSHAEPSTPPLTYQIPHSIGKGWPHYKDNFGKYRRSFEPSPMPLSNHNEIILTLTPIVDQALNRFGTPNSPKAIEHLVCQVIANAMAIPQISESIHTSEIIPWGRVPLLQAVVELLILLQK